MRYLTTTEAAAVLGVDPSRVRLLCQRGRIKTIRIGNTYAIAQRDLDRFAATRRRAGRPRGDGGRSGAGHASTSQASSDQGPASR